MSLIENERTKLLATWLNGVGVAAVAIGGIAPWVAVLNGSVTPLSAGASSAVCVAVGVLLHWGGRFVLGRLVP